MDQEQTHDYPDTICHIDRFRNFLTKSLQTASMQMKLLKQISKHVMKAGTAGSFADRLKRLADKIRLRPAKLPCAARKPCFSLTHFDIIVRDITAITFR